MNLKMDYEQIIANLQQVLFNQSRMLIECQTRIRDLELIVGVNADIPDEVVYGYLDNVEDGRVVHSDLVGNKAIDHICVRSNQANKIILFTGQLNHLKNLKTIEIQFDRGYSYRAKPTLYLAKNVAGEFQTENRASAAEFRKFCFERGIAVSFYDKNRGFYPDWDVVFA